MKWLVMTAIIFTGFATARADKMQAILQEIEDNCRAINAAVAKGNFFVVFDNESVTKGFCTSRSFEQEFPSGSDGKQECARVTQSYIRELLARGLPVMGAC